MSNRAAWIKFPKAQVEVDDAPTATAGPGEVVVKNYYVAINPIDWKVQTYGIPQQYPIILGQDIAGEVVEVGHGVSRLRIGDRVIA
jgi:NADPH:quinone reductase-like Zn-dependent oxidoreductase